MHLISIRECANVESLGSEAAVCLVLVDDNVTAHEVNNRTFFIQEPEDNFYQGINAK
jgi:hypothetical protein